jgi:acetyltransferase-like isoleucine patch superfamily enzyme
MGKSVRIDQGVELTFGYNLSIDDGVIVRNRALLDDRAEIHLGKGCIIGNYARIYSHTHDKNDYDKLVFAPTSIGAKARVGAHTVVLAGTHLEDGAIVGPQGTADEQGR